MDQLDGIRQELESKNQNTRQKIQQKQANAEYQEFLDDLGIDRIDAPNLEKTQTHSGRRKTK